MELKLSTKRPAGKIKNSNMAVKENSTMYYNTPSSWAIRHLFYLEWYGHFYCMDEYYTEREAFGNYLLLFTLNGEGKVNIGQNMFACKKGDIVLIDCDLPHSYGNVKDWEFLWFHFNGKECSSIADMILETRGNLFQSKNASMVNYFFELLSQGKTYTGREQELETSAYIQLILAELWKAGASTDVDTKNRQLIKNAMCYIEKNYNSKLSIADIAKAVGTSSSTLSHLFMKETNFTPYDYVVRKRIDQGKVLLRVTDKSIEQIAYDVGFGTASSFIRAFKQKSGMTPNEFRKKQGRK